MSAPAFLKVARGRFLRKMVVPSLIALALGYVLLALVLLEPSVFESVTAPMEAPSADPMSPSSRPPGGQKVETEINTFVLAWRQYSQLARWTIAAPEVCVNGETVNSLQESRCQKFWSRYWASAGLCAIPFAVVAVFLMLALDSLVSIYRKVNQCARKGPASFVAIATEPPEAPLDQFAWVYGFKKIRVQVGSHRQFNVYFPGENNLPLPGQSVAVFDCGKMMGKKRYFAMIYSPHVAVISG